jgi:hypothetical protein
MELNGTLWTGVLRNGLSKTRGLPCAPQGVLGGDPGYGGGIAGALRIARAIPVRVRGRNRGMRTSRPQLGHRNTRRVVAAPASWRF